MEKIRFKKPVSLHKYSVKINGFMADWKFILPVLFSIFGIFIGSLTAKGEGELYLKLCNLIKIYLLNAQAENIYINFLIYLILPSTFAVIIFFTGLSVYGILFVNVIPFAYSSALSVLVYYLYNDYALKGLGYIAIMILPYGILTLLSIILLTGESISMSQQIMKTLSKSKRIKEYNFTFYYKNCLKSYLFIIVATVIKILMDKLFFGLFIF